MPLKATWVAVALPLNAARGRGALEALMEKAAVATLKTAQEMRPATAMLTVAGRPKLGAEARRSQWTSRPVARPRRAALRRLGVGVWRRPSR